MWVTVHVLSGAALGAVLGAPGMELPLWVVLPAALPLHALLDLVPHWDYTRDRRRGLWAVLDLAASAVFVVGGWMALGLPADVVLAALVSAAPDLDVLDGVLPGRRDEHGRPRRRLFPSHWKRYPHGRARPLPGILVQAVVVMASLAITLYLA